MPDMPDIDRLREELSDCSDGDCLTCDTARFLLSLVDEGGRLVVEVPCEHGVVHDDCDQLISVCGHELCSRGWYIDARPGCWCPGGSRRVVWPEEEE